MSSASPAAAAPATVLRNVDWAIVYDEGTRGHTYAKDVDIAFVGDTLVHVGRGYAGPVEKEIDGRGRMVMPGLVDIHSHPSSEPMNKGLLDEVGSPRLYLSSLYEYMPLYRPDAAGNRAAMQVALSELAMSGVTTVADLSVPYEGWLDLAGQSGLRLCLAPMFRSARWFTPDGNTVQYEWNEDAGKAGLDNALQLIDRARQHPSGKLFGMVCPAQIDTCSAELIRDAKDAAAEKRATFQIHAAQSLVEFHEMVRRHGMTPIGWLDHLGVLGEQSIIGHAIFLDHHSWTHWPYRQDLGRLAETGTTVAHCPTVFSRRGVALEHFGAYVDAGVNMGIGTDTYPHNMLEEMRSAAIFARLTAENVWSVSTRDIFHAATLGGAKALGRDDIGRLAPGCKADLVLVDLEHPMMKPVRDPLRSLIYAAAERAVLDVYVGGDKVVEGGKVLTFDYAAAAEELEEAQARAMALTPSVDYAHRTPDVVTPLAFPLQP